jgi:GNAT superfamily N-acetyltransferase
MIGLRETASMKPEATASTITAHRSARGGIVARSVDSEPRIRRRLRAGDIGAIGEQHGRLYWREFGLDASFEADLARALYAAAERGWPSDREGIWIVERAEMLLGSLVLTDEGGGEARLRAFLLDPSLRGRGLGRRLLAELLERATAAGYELLSLLTFSELRAAAHLYVEHGFAVVSEETGPRWGLERMTYQRYELQLRAQERNSRSAGSSAAPFSVNA